MLFLFFIAHIIYDLYSKIFYNYIEYIKPIL